MKKVSNLFWNGGINISLKKPLSCSKKDIEKLYKKFGFILYRNSNINLQNLKKFTNKFTRIYANDARRRETTDYDKYINGVDEGLKKMTLHSEASFSPSWPEILWFYCLKPSKKFGETTFCDGINLWNDLSDKSKNFFLEYPIKFKLKIPVINPIKNRKKKSWPLNKVGSANAFINYKDGCLYVDQIRFAVNETSISNKLAFSNHFLYEGTDPTILKWDFVGIKKFPHEIKSEVKKKSDKMTYFHKWKKNDLIMIDNKRFMHGRNKILKFDQKKIYNLQTLFSKFSNNYFKYDEK